MEAIIYWRPPAGSGADRLDMEEYETVADAEMALAEFRKRYPWNTYVLATVKEVAEATQEWPYKPQITVVT